MKIPKLMVCRTCRVHLKPCRDRFSWFCPSCEYLFDMYGRVKRDLCPPSNQGEFYE